jgi:hypothetical protein
MAQNDFVGTWTLRKTSGHIKLLTESNEDKSFTIEASATAAGDLACTIKGGIGNQFVDNVLSLTAVPYHRGHDVLRGTCAGEIHPDGGPNRYPGTTFHVFVVCCPGDPRTCSGVIFAADGAGGGIGEDNSVGGWTATKQSGDGGGEG